VLNAVIALVVLNVLDALIEPKAPIKLIALDASMGRNTLSALVVETHQTSWSR
jgi:hypothetical protein